MKRAFLQRPKPETEAPDAVKDETRKSLLRSDLEYVCSYLFMKANDNSIRDRAMLTLDWAAVGRISEIVALRSSDIRLNHGGRDEGMVLDISRMKTVSDTATLLILCDRTSWMICPLHALGTMLATVGCIDGVLFPHVNQAYRNGTSEASGHVNSVFKQVYEYWKASNGDNHNSHFGRFSTHGIRKGSAAELNNNIQIHTTWIVDRGGWKLDLLHTIFSYIFGTRSYDAKVAKALGNWPDVQAKVYVPNAHSVDGEECTPFETFAKALFALCSGVEGKPCKL
jgi:integrase